MERIRSWFQTAPEPAPETAEDPAPEPAEEPAPEPAEEPADPAANPSRTWHGAYRKYMGLGEEDPLDAEDACFRARDMSEFSDLLKESVDLLNKDALYRIENFDEAQSTYVELYWPERLFEVTWDAPPSEIARIVPRWDVLGDDFERYVLALAFIQDECIGIKKGDEAGLKCFWVLAK